jgi:hypothetical protein
VIDLSTQAEVKVKVKAETMASILTDLLMVIWPHSNRVGREITDFGQCFSSLSSGFDQIRYQRLCWELVPQLSKTTLHALQEQYQ